MIRENLLTVDEFNNPKTVTDMKACAILLIRLLILVPGTNPLHPGMGVGLGSVYRFITEDDLDALRDRIQNQIETYMPIEFQSANIELDINDKHNLIVKAILNGTVYTYDTSETISEVKIGDII